MLNKIIALAIAAGFATASFAQSNAPAPVAAPAAKAAPAAAAAEKKVEAPKATEPATVEKTVVSKSDAKPIKVKHHARKAAKTEAKAAAATPAAK